MNVHPATEREQALRWLMANRRRDVPIEQAVRMLCAVLPRDTATMQLLHRVAEDEEACQPARVRTQLAAASRLSRFKDGPSFRGRQPPRPGRRMARRPVFSAAIGVAPEPPKQSNTVSPGRLELRSARSTSSTGFMVGCTQDWCIDK